tara:strand:- start:3074 stop:3955 length:882 start_codon:yes stop_codon:yes gene_type:complete
MKTFVLATNSYLILFLACFSLFCCATINSPSATNKRSKVSSINIRETFDPATLKNDFFIIQPTFSRDKNQFTFTDTIHSVIRAENPEKEIEKNTIGLIEQDTNSTQISQQLYRVQLLALSNGKNSRERYQKLTEQLNEPVYIQKRGDLFLISAGDFSKQESAAGFRDYVIELSEEYSDAFVISVEKPVTNIVKNPAVSESKNDSNFKEFSTFGWRVLLDQFLVPKQANSLREKAVSLLRRQDVDVIFKAPWYKVEVGHYTNENSVQVAAEEIQRIYPNAIKVRSQIFLPKNDK